MELVDYGEGGFIFTYVLNLDGLLRFTETSKTSKIKFLSRHIVLSDVNASIAYSGEFFVRRLPQSIKNFDNPQQKAHSNNNNDNILSDQTKDACDYQLIIDNESGTYKPKGTLLPFLKQFFNENFPGLDIEILNYSDEKLSKMKDEQRQRKEKVNLSLLLDDEMKDSGQGDLNKCKKMTGKGTKQGEVDRSESRPNSL